MGKQRVLIQDIADSLHLSRTTVSKVLNGNKNVSEANRKRVLQKASELNYKQFSYISESLENDSEKAPVSKGNKTNGNIAFLFHKTPDRYHIVSSLLVTFEQEIRKDGYTLSFYSVECEDIEAGKLPSTFDVENIDAILCAELFDKNYSRLLCSLNKPVLFADSYSTITRDNLKADILLMESKDSLSEMVRRIITANGFSKVGFVGAANHCLSFYERWSGFCSALLDCGLSLDKSSCILSEDDPKYFSRNWMINHLKAMDPLPELFVCANDAIAIHLIHSLKELNISVPSDVMVTGFDNGCSSILPDPSLTTVDVNSADMGKMAARQLLSRISNPALPYSRLYLQTEILFRQSASISSKEWL